MIRNALMTHTTLRVRFNLDPSKADQILSNTKVKTTAVEPARAVTQIIALELSIKTGGFVTGSGAVAVLPGEYYVYIRVPRLVAKLHEIAPYVAINELLSPEEQETYGISNFTVKFDKVAGQ
jgi:hypothetical protein